MRTATTRRRGIAFTATIAAMLSTIVSVGSASAVTLKGEWAPFNRCPVENPALLGANYTEGTLAVCMAVDSPSGALTIGNLSLTTGPSSTQAGVSGVEQVFSAVAPRGSAIVATPVEVPGGLAGLVCPKGADFKGDICTEAASRPRRLNTVVSTLESAGPPANLNLFAGLEVGVPIVTLPVKLHLQNPILGPNCYIGSNAHPFLMQPATVSKPATLALMRFDADGTRDDEAGVMYETLLAGITLADNTFAVGTATGCGVGGRLNAAINSTVGLPSPAGKNSMTLNEVESRLTGLWEPNETDGKDVSAYWHSAIIQ
jgi:hypothetical protein